MQNILKTLQKIKTTYIPSDTQTTTVLMFILLELCSLLRVKLTENEVFGGFLLTKTITAASGQNLRTLLERLFWKQFGHIFGLAAMLAKLHL